MKFETKSTWHQPISLTVFKLMWFSKLHTKIVHSFIYFTHKYHRNFRFCFNDHTWCSGLEHGHLWQVKRLPLRPAVRGVTLSDNRWLVPSITQDFWELFSMLIAFLMKHTWYTQTSYDVIITPHVHIHCMTSRHDNVTPSSSYLATTNFPQTYTTPPTTLYKVRALFLGSFIVQYWFSSFTWWIQYQERTYLIIVTIVD